MSVGVGVVHRRRTIVAPCPATCLHADFGVELGVRVQTWNETESYLIAEAGHDLEDGEDIRPCMVAFRDDKPLFVAFLRSFAKGAYDGPIVELLALAAPLDANRIAVSVGGRAWSLDDPVPPVVEGVGDLRQRVLCITIVEAMGVGVDVRSVVVPFTRTPCGVAWEPALRTAGGEGWMPSALRLAVEHRSEMSASRRDIRRQARRCVRLGHLLALGDGVATDLGLRGAVLG